MSANERQVGGHHYRGNLQHWDLAAARNYDYFQGQITKYIDRWKNKDGIKDLQKAQHFLEKYIEVELENIENGNATAAVDSQAQTSWPTPSTSTLGAALANLEQNLKVKEAVSELRPLTNKDDGDYGVGLKGLAHDADAPNYQGAGAVRTTFKRRSTDHAANQTKEAEKSDSSGRSSAGVRGSGHATGHSEATKQSKGGNEG